VLINRVVERLRCTGIRHRELRRRGRAARAGDRRAPLVIVPSCFGVRLVDARRRGVWGDTTRLFAGATFNDVAELHPDGILDGFPLIPGLYRQDVLGGLLRYLVDVGGYVLGEDLFALTYDWRRDMASSAAALDDLIRRLRGAGDQRVDLLAISSGGVVARAYLAGVHRDGGLGDDTVQRVLYLGAPQRGTFSAFTYSQEGFSFLARGKLFAAAPLRRRSPGLFDLLPHPSERIFVDRDGRSLDLDHLDPAVWRQLRLAGAEETDLADRLARVRRLHAALDVAAARHPPSVVIAGRHRPTAARAVVDGGKVVLPCPECAGDARCYPYAFEAGDGAVPAATMAAAPGLGPDGPWWVEPRAHHRIATEPFVHPLVLDALLSPLAPVPRQRYLWPRNPSVRSPDGSAAAPP